MPKPTRFNFTDDRLRKESTKALPEAGYRHVYDTKCHDLCCRVRKDSRVFYFSKWVKTRQRMIHIGPHTGEAGGVTIEEARATAGRLAEEIRQDKTPWADKVEAATKAGITMSDLWASYLQDHALASKRVSSVKMDMWLWARCLAPAFKCHYKATCPTHGPQDAVWAAKGASLNPKMDKGGKIIAGVRYEPHATCPICGSPGAESWTGGTPANEITEDACKALHAKITEERGATLANRALVLLATIFSKVKGHGNPAATCKDYRHEEEGRAEFLKAHEIALFWESLEEEADPWRLFFTLAICTGVRKGNILSMPWPTTDNRELDLINGRWTIPRHRAKGGKTLSVALDDALVQALQQWRTLCPSALWVFPNATDPKRHAVEPARAWDRILWRMEARRLVRVLGTLDGWEPQTLANEEAALPVLADQFWREALGRRESANDHPLLRVVEHLRERVTASGGNPAEGSVLAYRFHDIRRTVGTHMAMTGSTEAEIGAQIGHAPGSKATRKYITMGIDHKATIARKTSHMMRALGKPADTTPRLPAPAEAT